MGKSSWPNYRHRVSYWDLEICSLLKEKWLLTNLFSSSAFYGTCHIACFASLSISWAWYADLIPHILIRICEINRISTNALNYCWNRITTYLAFNKRKVVLCGSRSPLKSLSSEQFFLIFWTLWYKWVRHIFLSPRLIGKASDGRKSLHPLCSC